MKLGISVIAYNQATILKRQLESAFSLPTEHEIHYFIFAHTKAIIPICEELVTTYPPRTITVWPYGTNRGVARSWNDGLLAMQKAGMDVMLTANDDIWFTEGDLDKVVEATLTGREHYAVYFSGFNVGLGTPAGSLGMACYVLNPIAIEKVGYFDSNFTPAYNEDCDYDYRARLLGLTALYIKTTNIQHQGSATINSNRMLKQQNHMTHGKNDDYWKRKWGCEKGQVGYTRPFNNPRFTLRISAEDKEAPYPGFNRTDHNIVKL